MHSGASTDICYLNLGYVCRLCAFPFLAPLATLSLLRIRLGQLRSPFPPRGTTWCPFPPLLFVSFCRFSSPTIGPDVHGEIPGVRVDLRGCAKRRQLIFDTPIRGYFSVSGLKI